MNAASDGIHMNTHMIGGPESSAPFMCQLMLTCWLQRNTTAIKERV